MKAVGYKKRLPISDTESLMDIEVPTAEVGGRDRRAFLIAVGRTAKALAAAHILRSGAAILGPGGMLLRAGRADARTLEPLIQPSEIRSENGVLKATITAAPGRVQLGDFAFPGFLYNGAYMSPLLRPRLGDTMGITFRNNLPDDPSNLHYHGMGVSPQGNSDNVFIHVHPGQQFEAVDRRGAIYPDRSPRHSHIQQRVSGIGMSTSPERDPERLPSRTAGG